jgi:hypothetical protein
MAETTFMSRPIKAWTGGTYPKPVADIPHDEFLLVMELYKEQKQTFANAWGTEPDPETRLTFWNRARYDAHATFNQQ